MGFNGFLDENIFALKMDGKDNYVFLINESKYGFEINSIADINDFLIENYLSKNDQSINTRLNNNYEIKKVKELFSLQYGKLIKFVSMKD